MTPRITHGAPKVRSPWFRIGQAAARLVVFFSFAATLPACKTTAKNDSAPQAGSSDVVKPEPAGTPQAQQPGTFQPEAVERSSTAMGTTITFVGYTSPKADREATEAAFDAALAEIRRLESLMSSWREDSEVAAINRQAGSFVPVSPETFEVVDKSLWAGKVSHGTFDITFESMSDLWKFGDAQDESPTPPSPAAVELKRRLVNFRAVELDREQRAVRVPPKVRIGLGGIAKGYIVQRGADLLRERGVRSFLLQAGGDLFASGRKPDGAPWVSGIQDPRGPKGSFFAVLELTDRAFSTAGDYARSYLAGGRRYHHIIDPKTGYPATKSRSVTVWAPDAFVADVVDDAVFILGPKTGLELVESLPDVGVVIVDAQNQIHISERIKDKVRILKQPTDGI